jgi:GNAT superfamily N-acetyltransferase
MTRIRLATSADTADLVRMGLQFIAESGYRGLVTPSVDAQRAVVELLLEQGGCWVAVAGDQVVGMFGVALTPLPVTGELAGVEMMWWLDPQWRRGTLAMRLWMTGETWARDHGALWFQMIQPYGDERTGVLYRRRGYVPLESTWTKRLAA